MRSALWIMLLFGVHSACAQAKGGATGTPPSADQKAIHPNCLPGKSGVTNRVTHYYVPILDAYDHFTCDQMEGTCIYKKKGEDYLHNYGYTDTLLADARCKNGYGNKQNCLNPCRTIAASTRHHRWGEIHFIKSLVGQKCGNKRDGTEMVHDGFVVVGDTGAASHFNAPGRFDFFWGRCRDKANGVCNEGALPVSRAATSSDYCMVWNPANPLKNEDMKNAFVTLVKQEAISRGDFGAAEDFDLDKGFPKSLGSVPAR